MGGRIGTVTGDNGSGGSIRPMVGETEVPTFVVSEI